ncbi:Ribosomal protein S18 acetylase RimI [Nitrosomonas sp. Nm51]|uniref:GNAT family N-acetyltransferase n=1 Tax=Nitrosomonas sp. Nm51 TaxID=133720 RepID=UPI0008BF66FE|nr:GNAT family N-acetyltransferase [Nitrosomonas sp. Nm51]SER27449.1 Ribosomal protein S18 acetylase RimI [Nitrosomonas sp. Nm51]
MKPEAIDFSRFTLQQAIPGHCSDICDLVNLTYRGETGWTRETHIIGGNRTTLDEIAAAMAKPDAQFYVVYQRQLLAACIYLAKERYFAYVGFFSVHPDYQGRGVGKHILRQAEAIARQQLTAAKIRIFVVSQRPELIAFYERRGYQRIGNAQAYPLQLKTGAPKVPGLTIEYMEKHI